MLAKRSRANGAGKTLVGKWCWENARGQMVLGKRFWPAAPFVALTAAVGRAKGGRRPPLSVVSFRLLGNFVAAFMFGGFLGHVIISLEITMIFEMEWSEK